MNKFRARLVQASDSESGLTLIEVLVAMVIFAMVAVGVAYSMVSVLRLTNDARSKQTAANLASAEIDADRALASAALTTDQVTNNVVNLGPHTTVTTLDGVKYTIVVTTAWDTAGSSNSSQCSSGDGALLSKQVNVSVTWSGMSVGARPVHSDTIVSPDGRLTDINKGVIVVAVTDAAGAGAGGVTIHAVPDPVNPAGATAITSTINPTDADGCGLILQVVPGNYVVSISKANGTTEYLNEKQVAAPSASVPVTAGSSTSVGFQYDQSALVTPNYHSNYPNTPAVTVTMPYDMDTSFVSTNLIYTASTQTSYAGPFYLFPPSSGYTVLAGALAASGSAAPTCKSIDPGNWLTSSDGTLVGKTPPAIPTTPGNLVSPSTPVSMGIFQIKNPGTGSYYVAAQAQQNGPSGDPGCSTPSTYHFKVPSGTSATLALPFGSWLLSSGSMLTKITTNVPTTSVSTVTSGTISGSTQAEITLDPRTAP